ncbi:hypothetical protein ACFX14_028935 [Malus domestica]
MAEDCDSSSLVHLSVGGKKFSTTVGTLTQRQPDSMLAAMFSGRHTLCQDKKGYVFIDRDGEHFRHILNWLRDGEIPKLEASQYAELVKEAKYYQLLGLVDGILDVLNSAHISHSRFDYADAEGATFDNANLGQSTFSEANLRGASFVGAKNYNLAGASCVEDCRY